MKVAYIVSRYPAVSHTFILREVMALRHLGLDIQTFSVRASTTADRLSAADEAEFARTHTLLPARLFDLFIAHLLAFFLHPLGYFQTLFLALRMNTGGIKSKLWHFFYFVEAILVWRECRRRGISHLHAHFANVSSDLAMLAAHFANVLQAGWTWSFTMHGPTEFYSVERHQLPDKIRSASLVVCISDFCRSQLMAMVAPEQWSKLQVVHCGVDVEQFAPRDDTFTPADPVEILCVGRLVSVKGQHVLLEALQTLVRRGRNVHVTLIGDGPDRQRLQEYVKAHRLTDFVSFTGALGQDLVPAYYQSADIFCLPSFAEGVPVVLMEALASGIPVVSSRIMGIPELVEQGRNGLLTSPGRVDQLTEALDHLISSPAMRRTMGQHGRAKVAGEFDVHRSALRLADFFLHLSVPRIPQPDRTAAETLPAPILPTTLARS